jgi:uncharacterized protein YbjT (DUF2867 family)
MKVLLAGANSYIGTRLIPVLLEKGYEVFCLVRDKNHFLKHNPHAAEVTVINGDLLRRQSINPFPADIDAAYYLINTFTQTSGFAALSVLCAQNFMDSLNRVNCRQIITLSEINNQDSEHGRSRMLVEEVLASGKAALTAFNTTMIVGDASTALEMFYILTSKAPVVIAQNWAKMHAQPICIIDVLGYLEDCLLNEGTFNRKFDIGGPGVLLFRQMLLMYIAIYKDFKPKIVTLPFLNSQLSSHLLNLLTTVSYPEAQTLVENLKYDTVCRDNSINDIIPRRCLTFKQSLRLARDTSEKTVSHLIT